MNVYVSSIFVPMVARNKRIYGSITNNTTTVTTTVPSVEIPQTKLTPNVVIEFVNTSTPEVLDYNTLYAPEHGQYPRIELFTIDENGNRWKRQDVPIYVMTNKDGDIDDLIDSIRFDLSREETGFILIN